MNANFKDFVEHSLQVFGRNFGYFDQTLLQVLIVGVVLNASLDVLQNWRQTILERHDYVHFFLMILNERRDGFHRQIANLK